MQTLLRALLVTLGHLPLPILRAWGWLFAQLLILPPNRFRRVSELHLMRCLPEISAGERERIARRSLLHSLYAIFEAPAIWYGPLTRRRHWMERDSDALSIVEQARMQGRGAILLTPHQGAWELSAFYCARLAPLTVLYKPQKGAIDAVIRDGRGRGGDVHPVPTTGAGVRALLGALKRGEMVGILPDHDPPEGSGTVFAPLFGIPANTMDLVSKLAARSGAPVLFFIVERLPWARGFRFHVLPAPEGINDPRQGAAALNKGVEACIRLLPDQYWWSYKRYRRRPVGEPPFYPPKT
jgi:KDO2-lipid IV(A) lauroyltransferase